MLSEFDNGVPVSRISHLFSDRNDLQIDMLRLDLLHPEVSGNKWYKLKNNLQRADQLNIKIIFSFGGVWSNHIHALAAAGRLFDYQTIAVIRGERPEHPSAMLQDVERWGMKLVFVTRAEYRQRYDAGFHKILLERLGLSSDQVFIVPEGGSGELGVQGCQDILAAGKVNPEDYDEIWLACGTGATMGGVIRSCNSQSYVRGFPVLKGADFLFEDIRRYLKGSETNWTLELDHHCGGYGKTTPELLEWLTAFEKRTGVPVDQVYTGKLALALKQRKDAGLIPEGQRLLLIHTGGLQGKRGLK